MRNHAPHIPCLAIANKIDHALSIYSEERTSSTHALTMYRKDMEIDGTEYKIGKSRKLGYNLVCKSNRYLGHSWIRILQLASP